MTKKQAFLKKVTIVSGTVLALSSLTGCFGKDEASSKEKGKKKTEEVKKEKKPEKEKEKSEKEKEGEKEPHPTDENVMHVSSKKESSPISTTIAKKYLTEDETKQLTTILQTNQKSKIEQEKLPTPAIEPPKIEPSPPVILTPLGNTSNSKESISLEKPTPPINIEKPKVKVELPTEPDKPTPPVIMPPTDDGGGINRNRLLSYHLQVEMGEISRNLP